MADYGAWQGLGNALQTGGDAFARAKAARRAQEESERQAARQDEQDSMTRQKFQTESLDSFPQYEAPKQLGLPPGFKLNRGEALSSAQKLAEISAQRQAKAQEAAAKKAAGRPLGAQTAEELGDRLAIPAELQRNAADVKANPDLLGPENVLATKIPFAFSERKDVASKVGSIRKLAARAIEGARLTDSDMEYYTRNLPSETDTPQEFENKTNNLIGLLSRATGERVGSLGKAGFDVSGYDSDMQRLGELGKLTGETGQTAQPQTGGPRIVSRRPKGQ